MGLIPGSQRSPGDHKDTRTYSSMLARRNPWTEELGRLWSIGAQRVGHDWSDLAHVGPNGTFFGWTSMVISQCMKVKVLVPQSCPTLCNPMDWSPPGSSVYGILQVRTLQWVAISLSKISSWPRNRTWVFCIAGGVGIIWATREVQSECIEGR